jgi:hypothetical protein
MKIPSSRSKNIIALLSAMAVLAAYPLITGAAPTQAPPDGLITPTFSGLLINDGSADNLTVNSNGDISNQAAGNLPVKISDNEGVQFTTTSGRGTVMLVPNQTQSYWQNTGYVNSSLIGQPFKIFDSQGIAIADDNGDNTAFGVIPVETNGSPERGIYANAPISNSGTDNGGAVLIDDEMQLTGRLNTPDIEITSEYTATDCTNDGGEFYVPPMSNPICLMPVRIQGGFYGGSLKADTAIIQNGVSAGWLGTTGFLNADDIIATGTIEATGKITSASGFGTVRTYTATSASIANGATGTVYRGCDEGVLIACGYNADNNWYVYESYKNFNPSADPMTRCRASARNSTGAADTFIVQAICLDSSS